MFSSRFQSLNLRIELEEKISSLIYRNQKEEKRSPPLDLMLMGKTTQKRFFWKRNASKSRSDTSLIHNVRR
jgi:hypothetical protein